MKYGVFSDVHGNYQALQAVLEFFRKNGVKSYVFCGDLVGYGPPPQECVETVAALPQLSAVMGNHDGALAGRLDIKWFNANAAAALEYARARPSGKSLAFLANLPERVDLPAFTVVHGSPRKPLTEYMLNERQFAESAGLWLASPCFIGHSHMPMYFRARDGQPAETNFLAPQRTLRADDGRLMLNPGSVGQPRDGDPRASCGIYDDAARGFELFRVFYDVGETQAKMREAGLPAALAERLSFGY